MERFTLTPDDEAAISAIVNDTQNYVTNVNLIIEGTNLVAGDQVTVNDSWTAAIFAGDDGGSAWCCMPQWGSVCLPIADLADFVTDRAGPNGETMPIYDEVQAQARSAAKTQAVEADTKQKHGHHRSLESALRDAIKRLPHDKQKHARETLKKHGVLGGKDDGHE
jgi:hypothetical protein